MPSTITITCLGGCGRRMVVDASTFDNWTIPDTCTECADRQMVEFFQQGEHLNSPQPEQEPTRHES